jgi:hypothetical protein
LRNRGGEKEKRDEKMYRQIGQKHYDGIDE